MSHFTVLVIGDNPEDQLAPFDENLRTDFNDKKEEYQKEYDTEMVSEFYCDSHSSWGMRITPELFEDLKKSKVGRVINYKVTKLDPMSYLKENGKYKGYYEIENGKRCKGDQWFEVEKVLQTTHPDPTTCFEGEVRIRKISKPKKIALKDKYPVYEDYLKEWHGVEDIDHQGYDYNPKAKWDWYQLGGRWTGFFKLKPQKVGILGKPGLMTESPKEFGVADQALKRDIDFERMAHERFEESCETYKKFDEEWKSGKLKPFEGYWNYGVENTGDRDNYIPETREQFLKRRAAVTTFAVLKDGEWYERGEMGWWACVSNEKDPEIWNTEFKKLIDELPEDTLLSVYDCHI